MTAEIASMSSIKHLDINNGSQITLVYPSQARLDNAKRQALPASFQRILEKNSEFVVFYPKFFEGAQTSLELTSQVEFCGNRLTLSPEVTIPARGDNSDINRRKKISRQAPRDLILKYSIGYSDRPLDGLTLRLGLLLPAALNRLHYPIGITRLRCNDITATLRATDRKTCQKKYQQG